MMKKHIALIIATVYIALVLTVFGSHPWLRDLSHPAQTTLSETVADQETLNAGLFGSAQNPYLLPESEFSEPAILVLLGFGLISFAAAMRRSSKHT